jgi:hypothetical protein
VIHDAMCRDTAYCALCGNRLRKGDGCLVCTDGAMSRTVCLRPDCTQEARSRWTATPAFDRRDGTRTVSMDLALSPEQVRTLAVALGADPGERLPTAAIQLWAAGVVGAALSQAADPADPTPARGRPRPTARS